MTLALVLGGAGFIGVALFKELMPRGMETIAAGRKDRPYGIFTGYVVFDSTDEDRLSDAASDAKPDALLDLACHEPAEIEAAIRTFNRAEELAFAAAL